jgi:very-short-patch-repair endonuclease
MLPDSTTAVWEDPNVRQFLSRFRKERREQALYVGYPTRLLHIRARSGWEGFLVQPLIVFELQFDSTTPHPLMSDSRPELNFEAIGSLSDVSVGEILDEAIELQTEIGLNAEVVTVAELPDILTSLQEARTDWPWQEHLDPFDVEPTIPLSETNVDGIFNRAILLASEQSRFTRGLETELRMLEKKSRAEYTGTALEWWVDRPARYSPSYSEHETILEVLPLNIEQRAVVQNALTRPLTIVTGPPGTGKSQLVANIVANCAWRGQTVLVASKNNKAVDVVEERVNSIGSRPLLLRLGANQYQARLSEYFSTLLSAASDSEDEASYRQCLQLYESQINEREALMEQLDSLTRIRNELDEISQQLEQARDILGEEAFNSARGLDYRSIRTAVCDAMASAKRATRECQGAFTRLVWPLVRSKRLSDSVAEAQKLESLNRDLSLPCFPLNEHDGSPILDALERLSERLELVPAIQHYYSELESLRQHPSTTQITHATMNVNENLRSTFARLWQLWLRVQPSTLTMQDRRLLGNYRALLEMRITADRNRELMGGHAFREFMQMFPELVRLLPAWAVTNLSARGRLPFESGMFDLLVIDEASQCDIASALPLLYRSKRALIIGDPKQLRHITHIPEHTNQLLMRQYSVHDIGSAWGYPNSSLYDLAAALSDGPIIALRDHHRSDNQIIGFSNKHFYEERLRVATDHARLLKPYAGSPSLQWCDITGRVHRPAGGSAVNKEEARAVVEELERLVVEHEYSGSVGVITPFRAQANQIRELIHENDAIMKTAPNSNLLIDTVYRFQGDERDVIIFSPVVSKDTPNSTLRFLARNANTFNVAVTRARATLIVVGDYASCSTCGVIHLEAFTQYVANQLETPQLESESCEPEFGPEYPAVSNPEQVSEWERWFYRILYQHGMRPIPQFNIGHYVVDFALINGERKLAIEIDGEYYHRQWTGDLARRDQIRNARLIEMGWDVERFWVYQLHDDLDYCLDKILRWYQQASSEGPREPRTSFNQT